MKNLDMKKFKEMSPCKEGYEFVLNLKTTDLKIIFDALKEHNLEWSNWLIARLLARKYRIRYAVFAAEQVLDIFEKSHPGDLRPRQAIEAAIMCIKKNTQDNRAAAYAAYAAASWTAASAAYAADAAASWTAAYAASWAAAYAAYAAYAAAEAASAADARQAMKAKIVNYGLQLLGVERIEK